jgi:hypothetical protein
MKENNTYHQHSEGDNLPEYLRVNPFIVPEGYFDHLESKILLHLNPIHNLAIQKETFQVPEGYFDDLQSRILATAKLEQLTPSIPEGSFTVPNQYFETLQDRISSRIAEEKLREEVNTDGFQVATGYMDELTQSIMANISLEQMTGGVTKDGFAVPADYFDKLSIDLKRAIAPEEKTTPVRRLNNSNWVRYVAAACIVAVLGIGTFFGLRQPTDSTMASEATLSNISDDEIMNYLAATSNGDDMVYFTKYIYQPDDAEGVGKQIDKEDLEEYLNYTL